jgi:allophanate hydrolase
MALDYSLDLVSLATAYSGGTLTPTRVVRDIYAIIADEGRSPVWIHLADERAARAAADALERSRATTADLPLYGFPFAVKDNIDVAGMPTTAGCPGYEYVAQETAFAVRRLQDAGALLIGKTNLDQFATGLTGTRSPYGECANPFDPRYISGGSSSGSAVAVASGLVSFALGTDTAGSGRVPAGCNNIVGLKPTRGLVSTSGVVPACRSLDCVSILALTCGDARSVFEVARTYDAGDPYSRAAPMAPRGAKSHPRFGVPRQLEFFDDSTARLHYDHALALLVRTGGTAVEIDFTPFAEVAQLLYEGPWIAERLAAIQAFSGARPEAFLPVTLEIIRQGARYSAVDVFEAAHRLQVLKRRCDEQIADLDALVVPTTPTIYTREQVAESPVELNARLGYYTNFVNLLDYCAVSVPAGLRRDGLPAGVTLVAPAFSEAALLELAARMHRASGERLGATGRPLPSPRETAPAAPHAANPVVLAVVGAHLSGLPLNHQLTGRGACLIGPALTAPAYRLYELSGGTPRRPGIVRAENGHGVAIEVELWSMPAGELGAFIAGIPAPLTIGSVALADGREVKGFICEHYAVRSARDISEFGGWRKFLAAGEVDHHGHAG